MAPPERSVVPNDLTFSLVRGDGLTRPSLCGKRRNSWCVNVVYVSVKSANFVYYRSSSFYYVLFSLLSFVVG